MHTHWTSMLWSIDNCQNRVPVSLELSCRPIEVKYFFEVIRWLLVTRFQMIAGSSLIFLKIHIKYVVFLWRTIKILILNWPRTRIFSQLLQAGKTVAFDFALHGHALVTLYVHFWLVKIWVHAENLCSILNLVYLDSWSWQSFVSTCDVFHCLFPLDVQNKFSCYQESSVIYG